MTDSTYRDVGFSDTTTGVDDSPETPTVLNWVILKIAQRCNLNCSYCYVYNRGDSSWKSRPVIISRNVLAALAGRIRDQCSKYQLTSFTIELHGGEPLLIGRDRMRELVELLRAECAGIELRIIMQTNGLLLDEQWLQLFDEGGISFGLSLDGPPEFADQFRVFHDGRGSTHELLRKIEALRGQGPLFDRWHAGTLCVINPAADGAQMVRWFVERGFKSFDFLLPDGNYSNYPPEWRGVEPFRRFLISAFEEWYGMGAQAPRIRKFEVLIRSFMGVKTVLDALGGDLSGLCVVESDGSIGVSDVARICGGSFSQDSLSVFRDPLDTHAEHYGLKEIQRCCATCQSCRYFANCGGGYLPHRFDGKTFDNPSIYCDALFSLIGNIHRHLKTDVPSRFWRKSK